MKKQEVRKKRAADTHLLLSQIIQGNYSIKKKVL